MDKEQVKKVLEKKQKEVERFAYDIKNWSIPLFDREFIKALQYAIEAIEEKDRLKELTKPENCKHFSSGHCNIADNSVGRTDCNVGGCPDFEAKLKKAEETITHGIEELVKVTQERDKAQQHYEDKLDKGKIEEILIKKNKEISDTVERYGDYFYRLAQAILDYLQGKKK